LANLTPYIEIWDKTLTHIKENEKMASTSYQSWFEPLTVVDCRNDRLYLGSSTDFIINWINDHYRPLVCRNLEIASAGEICDFQMVLLNNDGTYVPENDETETAAVKPAVKAADDEDEDFFSSSLNPRYTFDTFVVGDNNRFAHAASLAVAEVPGKVYNPLFIQGGAGLGKTHLMQAIGHFIKENNRNAKVAYFTTESFVNEWINAIQNNTPQNNTPEKFRSKYRKADVILMDDIQFLSKKGSCQEEFFHTYNALYESGAQIILSSDRPPYEIPELEERLVSRFLWGLTSEIVPPDMETRIAILQKKAALNNIIIPHNETDVFFYIANQYDSNIRILEGALNRVVAFSKMRSEPITLSLTMKALENFVSENRIKVITVELIQQTTAKYFNIKPEEMKSQRRTAHITFPRQIAMYLCREMTDVTFEKIGEEFGRRHYTTVMHAHDEIAKKIKTDKNTAKYVKELTESIRKM
jgi:chromosomal replication initiator protein